MVKYIKKNMGDIMSKKRRTYSAAFLTESVKHKGEILNIKIFILFAIKQLRSF